MKAIYDSATKIVSSYINPEDEPNHVIDEGNACIEISKEEYCLYRSKPCKVIDGVYQRYYLDKRLEDVKHWGRQSRIKYLESNTKLISRSLDPTVIDQATLDKRAQAIAEYDEIGAATTYEEAEHLTTDFN